MGQVIAGFDGSDAGFAAVEWAAAEARLRGLHLQVHTYLEPADVPGLTGPSPEPEALRERLLPRVREATGATDPDFRILPGEPRTGLVDAALDDDLLVVGSHGRSALIGLLLGDVSHACLHLARCTVVIVPATGAPRPPHRRVIAGLDGSGPAVRALRVAAREAELRGAALQAVHAVHWSPLGAELTEPDDTELVAWGRRLVESALTEAGVSARPVIIPGHPSEVLARHADHADLLVIGSRGRGPVASLLAGSTAANCARHSRCPVMLVR